MKAKVCVIGSICLIIVPCVYSVFSPWSRIICSEHDIDLDSGRRRTSSFLYWIRFNTEYRDTSISAEIYDGDINEPKGEWVKVSSFSPFTRNSPHYNYHAATNQMKLLQLYWDEMDSDKATREDNARSMLKLWKEHGNDKAADVFILRLYEEL